MPPLIAPQLYTEIAIRRNMWGSMPQKTLRIVLSAKHLFIFLVAADPKPKAAVRHLNRKCTKADPDPYGPESTNFFQVK